MVGSMQACKSDSYVMFLCSMSSFPPSFPPSLLLFNSVMEVSRFLHAMQGKGVLRVKEMSKGMESVIAIDFSHPL